MPAPRRLALVLLCTALVLAATPAPADDHEPPVVVLRVGNRAQTGRLGDNVWGFGSCGVTHYDVFGNLYPAGLRVQAGTVAARVEFRKMQPPEALSIKGWTRLDDSRPRGPRGIEYTLSPTGDGTSWVVEVTLPVEKHLYVDVRAEWPDQEQCADRQYGRWHFHLRTRQASRAR